MTPLATDAQSAFKRTLATLVASGKIPPWASGLQVSSIDSSEAAVEAENGVALEAAASPAGSKHLETLSAAVSASLGRRIRVVVAAPKAAQDNETQEATRRTDRFVVAAFNEIAYGAVNELMCGRPPGTPVLIHGPHGTGKTRLLADAKSALPEAYWTTAEGFANGFISSLKDRTVSDFRRAFRAAGVLIMDDVHFLAGKPRIQDELVIALESIKLRGGSALLSSSVAPWSMNGISERLGSWLRGGFPAEIKTLGPDALRQIAIAKAEQRGVVLPRDVLDIVTSLYGRSIREVEGAINRLTALSPSVDASAAKTLLDGAPKAALRSLELDEVADAVSRRFLIPVSEIRGQSRKRRIAAARKAFAWLASRLTRATLTAIGEWCGGRDHSTVIYSVNRIESGDDAETRAEAEAVEALLMASAPPNRIQAPDHSGLRRKPVVDRT